MALPDYNFHFSYGLCLRALAINPHKNQNRLWQPNVPLKMSDMLDDIIGLVPSDVCSGTSRVRPNMCTQLFSLFFFECVCAYVSVITHLRMAHWSFAHNNDMLVLPTHKCALALHTAPFTVHSAQDGRIMHEDSVQKHKNDVFCCWIFNNKKKNEKTNKNTMHVYREMKCIYTNAMILCRQRTSWRIGCVFDWNKYIHSINTQNAFREQKWRLKWTPNGENEKRKYYRLNESEIVICIFTQSLTL